MIIRLTMSESDFISDLEEFCHGLRDRMFTFEGSLPESFDDVSTEEKIEALLRFLDQEKEARERRAYLMNPERRFQKNSKEHRMICNEVLRLWEKFAPTVDLEEFTPHVSVQYSLEEQWENSEVVYYFTAYDRCIVQ